MIHILGFVVWRLPLGARSLRCRLVTAALAFSGALNAALPAPVPAQAATASPAISSPAISSPATAAPFSSASARLHRLVAPTFSGDSAFTTVAFLDAYLLDRPEATEWLASDALTHATAGVFVLDRK